MGFYLYTGNDLEKLAEEVLCKQILSKPLSDPFKKETIIVQSRGMAAWLKLQIADNMKICANIEFPFLNKFINEILEMSLKEKESSENEEKRKVPDTKQFSIEAMTWRIYSLLEDEIENFPELYTYIKDGNKELKQFQLSEKIAETFDQYLIYRPEMILNWEKSMIHDNSYRACPDRSDDLTLDKETFPIHDNSYRACPGRSAKTNIEREKSISQEINHDESLWQTRIWKELTANYTSTAKGFQNFFSNNDLSAVPHERIILFGISYMPLIFLDFFKKLGETNSIDVHFFYLNPCEDNWYFNLSEKQVDKFLSKSSSLKNLSEDELYLNEGNKLLINYGQAGREFLGSVLNVTEGSYEDYFTCLNNSTILESLQNDILKNNVETQYLASNVAQASSPSKENVETQYLASNVNIHNCHSRTREVEVLYDNIMNYITKNPELQPKDIIVMAPDISAYASTIKSVFNSRNKELNPKRKTLPYSLSDVNIALHSKIIQSYFDILNLNFTKFKMTDIMDILETKAVYQAFGIEDNELDHIRKWVIESGMRWGIDAEHRSQLNLPGFYENSISFAFDRMLLGYSMEDNGESYLDKIIPYDEIELSTSPLLGKFSYFMETLTQVKDLISKPDTIHKWVSKLNQILDKFFTDDNTSYKEIVRIRKIIDSLSEIGTQTNFDKKISFEIIKYYLSQKAGSEKVFEGFLRGKITFCTMQPMRTVPAKVICLLGMNEGAFPREERKVGFNIMDKNIRFCDKSKTLEDRFIFLESLLAAKSSLYISYIGNDDKTNETSQPSIVVCELMDYLKSIYGKSIEQSILINERLHGFSEIYLNNSEQNHFTYLQSNLTAAETLRNKAKKRLFAGSKIENCEFDYEEINLSNIITFYKNPCKYFITKSLSARFNINDTDIIEDTEPIDTNPLERYMINKKIIHALIEDKPTHSIYERMVKESSIPIGNFGKIRFNEQDKLIRDVFKKVNKVFSNKTMKELLENTKQFNFDIKLKMLKTIEFSNNQALKLNSKLPAKQIKINTLGYNCTLNCELDFVQINSHQFCFDPGNFNGKRAIESWLKHLAVCSQFPCPSYCLFKDKAKYLKPIESSIAIKKLTELIEIFNAGLKTPIPFLPKTSYAYAEAEKKKLEKTEKTFFSDDYNQGEDSDFYTKLCFDKTIFEGVLFEEFKLHSKNVFSHYWKDEKED